jgi:hypothetical protein
MDRRALNFEAAMDLGAGILQERLALAFIAGRHVTLGK